MQAAARLDCNHPTVSQDAIIDTRLDKLHHWLAEHYSIQKLLGWDEQARIHAEVRALIDGGMAADRIHDEKTLLSAVSASGCLDSMRFLISAGAAVDPPTFISPTHASRPGIPRRHTPLMMAASYDQIEACQLLVEAGADINTLDEDNETALFWAARQGAKRVVAYLIDLGCELETKSNYHPNVLANWADAAETDNPNWQDCGRLLVAGAAQRGYSWVTTDLLDELNVVGAGELGRELLALQDSIFLEQQLDQGTAQATIVRGPPRL